MIFEAEYQAALDYIYNFVDFSLVRNLVYSPDTFSLEPMAKLAHLLGDPQAGIPIIHVAGTKGKGSVSALCGRALQAAGYRTGLYTSPHLHDFNERIQVNGEPITHADFTALVDEMRPAIEATEGITTFSIATALALLYFKRQETTAIVLETGLGGRLDSTNIVSPAITVITSISYDHINILGDTLTKIAGEKAGIIKPGVPLIVSPQVDEARLVIEETARRKAAPLIQVGREVLFEPGDFSLEGQSFKVWEAGSAEQIRLFIPLLGSHQVENAATAWAVLRAASGRGLVVSPRAIEQGFARVAWPGRFEVLRREPAVVVDSAHNRDSARRLRETLAEYFPGKPAIWIFGASEDKDINGMYAELKPVTRKVITTRAIHPRATSPEVLVELAAQHGLPAEPTENIPAALGRAVELAGEDCVVLAAGSIFLAAEVRQAWLERIGAENER